MPATLVSRFSGLAPMYLIFAYGGAGPGYTGGRITCQALVETIGAISGSLFADYFRIADIAHKLQTYNIAWCCEAQKVPIGATVAGDYYCLRTRSRGHPKENGWDRRAGNT